MVRLTNLNGRGINVDYAGRDQPGRQGDPRVAGREAGEIGQKEMRFDLDHIALNVRDMDSMLRFYIAVLGLKPERLDLYRKRKAPFPSVRVNADTIIDLFPAEMWQGKLGTRSRKPKPDSRLNHVCLAIRKGNGLPS